jgi:hypothetical protein
MTDKLLHNMSGDVEAFGITALGSACPDEERFPVGTTKINGEWYFSHAAAVDDLDDPIDEPDLVVWEREQ